MGLPDFPDGSPMNLRIALLPASYFGSRRHPSREIKVSLSNGKETAGGKLPVPLRDVACEVARRSF